MGIFSKRIEFSPEMYSQEINNTELIAKFCMIFGSEIYLLMLTGKNYIRIVFSGEVFDNYDGKSDKGVFDYKLESNNLTYADYEIFSNSIFISNNKIESSNNSYDIMLHDKNHGCYLLNCLKQRIESTVACLPKKDARYKLYKQDANSVSYSYDILDN